MIFNLPNCLTLLRIACIPVIAALMMTPEAWAAWTALGIYTVACISDWLDGYLARRMNITSAFGRFLDPIADKLLTAILLLMFAGLGRLEGLWIIPAAFIIFREVFVAGLREFLGPHKIIIHVSTLSKRKTMSQMIAMGFLVVGDFGNPVLPNTVFIGHILISISAVLTIITGWDYMRQGMKAISKIEKNNK
ncbi:MAG: CDP-diacylglycerol--glycerol-3-phosphate 3-phosphatidyltransferase [Alphaproteobacteria bacterium]|nr:MAG: CDP-diacylglycerol--glycerol-3-phosphate 3-phosphatidyltransferase [Alphaproteobacteria bacterium]